jgi:CDP-6-deoxy-D-xylo-4-hexulose-3-dehydrase
MGDSSQQLREQILQLAERYFEEKFKAQPFVPGQSNVPVSGKVLDASDLKNLIDASPRNSSGSSRATSISGEHRS